MYTQTKRLIVEMLKENTGVHMCDSGGSSGRAWQQNQDKLVSDFEAEDRVYIDNYYLSEKEASTDNLCYTISVFHYLVEQLDEINFEINRVNNLTLSLYKLMINDIRTELLIDEMR